MSKTALILLFLAGIVYGGDAPPLKKVKNWTVTGRFEKPLDVKNLPSVAVAAQMRRYHPNAQAFADSAVPLKFSILDENNFRIESGKVLGDPEGIYSIGVFLDGQVGTLESINVLQAQPELVGFQLKLIESSKIETLKGRLVDPDTLLGVPGINLRIKLHSDTFPEDALRDLVIATVSTGIDGYFSVESVPKGYYSVSTDFSNIHTAIPDGSFLQGEAKLLSQDKTKLFLHRFQEMA